MPPGRTRHVSFAIAARDTGVRALLQLPEVTAIWQIACQFSPFVSEEVPVRLGRV